MRVVEPAVVRPTRRVASKPVEVVMHKRWRWERLTLCGIIPTPPESDPRVASASSVVHGDCADCIDGYLAYTLDPGVQEVALQRKILWLEGRLR